MRDVRFRPDGDCSLEGAARAARGRVPRRGARLPAPAGARWSVPWSDLMLTMFVLFVALYLVERETRDEAPLPQPRPVGIAIPEPFAGGRAAFELPAPEGVELVAGRTPRIALTGDVLFASGSAQVRPEALPLLEHVAWVIRRAPPHLRAILVSGHSDDRPIRSERFPSNWELSAARAGAVARALIEHFGLEAGRFVVSGHAHHRPREVSSDPAARARNRRVEILLTGAVPGAPRPS